MRKDNDLQRDFGPHLQGRSRTKSDWDSDWNPTLSGERQAAPSLHFAEPADENQPEQAKSGDKQQISERSDQVGVGNSETEPVFDWNDAEYTLVSLNQHFHLPKVQSDPPERGTVGSSLELNQKEE